jgi:hypothetical protein
MSNQSAKMWSGRFREPLDPIFESWQRSFPFDWRLVPYEVEASIAHARAIEAAGILTSRVPHSSRGLLRDEWGSTLPEAGAKAKPKRLNIAFAFAVVLVFALQPSDDLKTNH